jgi:DNA-binding PadR family transcriptional regulator
MKQREMDINNDTTFEEIGREMGEDGHTLYACNRSALKKALKMLEEKGFKKSDFFGEK